MSVISIQPTFPLFAEADGSPLEAGFIYIGTVNLNPELNEATVYWDFGQTIPASQPIRTIGGRPSRNGSAARVYIQGDYSMTVRNRNSVLVYSALSHEDTLLNSEQVTDFAELRTLPVASGDVLFVKHHTSAGDGGGGDFRGVTGAAPGTYVDNNGTIIVPSGGDGSAAWLRDYHGIVNIQWFGGDTQAAIDSVATTGGTVTGDKRLPVVMTGVITVKANVHLIGLVFDMDDPAAQIRADVGDGASVTFCTLTKTDMASAITMMAAIGTGAGGTATNVTFSDNIITVGDNTTGFNSSTMSGNGTPGFTAQRNRIVTGAAGILIKGLGAAEGINVSDNHIVAATLSTPFNIELIKLESCSGVASNNYCETTNSTDLSAMTLESDCHDLIVGNNTLIHENGGVGLRIENADSPGSPITGALVHGNITKGASGGLKPSLNCGAEANSGVRVIDNKFINGRVIFEATDSEFVDNLVVATDPLLEAVIFRGANMRVQGNKVIGGRRGMYNINSSTAGRMENLIFVGNILSGQASNPVLLKFLSGKSVVKDQIITDTVGSADGSIYFLDDGFASPAGTITVEGNLINTVGATGMHFSFTNGATVYDNYINGMTGEKYKRTSSNARIFDNSNGELTVYVGANFQDKTHIVNLPPKTAGQAKWDSTTTKPLYANGASDVAVWKDAAGATVYTPV